MKELIKKQLEEGIFFRRQTIEKCLPDIESAAKIMIFAYKRGNKILFCGNGGSAADSQHLAAELVGRFHKERRALAAISLTTNTSILTAISNDYSYDYSFQRQVEALGQRGDILFAISTSGNSQNVLNAIDAASKIGMKTICLTGLTGGKMGALADIAIKVPSKETPRIQEVHIAIGHILCELVEEELFK